MELREWSRPISKGVNLGGGSLQGEVFNVNLGWGGALPPRKVLDFMSSEIIFRVFYCIV